MLPAPVTTEGSTETLALGIVESTHQENDALLAGRGNAQYKAVF
jgi:hypothetical protein